MPQSRETRPASFQPTIQDVVLGFSIEGVVSLFPKQHIITQTSTNHRNFIPVDIAIVAEQKVLS